MKAEPESRLEKGHDIKFSIDDLAAKTEPEPWEGMCIFLVSTLIFVLTNDCTQVSEHIQVQSHLCSHIPGISM